MVFDKEQVFVKNEYFSVQNQHNQAITKLVLKSKIQHIHLP